MAIGFGLAADSAERSYVIDVDTGRITPLPGVGGSIAHGVSTVRNEATGKSAGPDGNWRPTIWPARL